MSGNLLTKNSRSESNEFTFEAAQKSAQEINHALKAGDMETARKGLELYQKNRPAFEKAGYDQNRFIRESVQGVENQQALTQFFRMALEVGFTVSAVLAASVSVDRQNDSQTTAALAASNASFGQALIALIMDYINKETDDKIKKDLLEKKDSLEGGLGVGDKELKEGSKEFDRFMKKIDDVLKDKTEIKLLSALYLHANLKAPLGNAFAGKPLIEES